MDLTKYSLFRNTAPGPRFYLGPYVSFERATAALNSLEAPLKEEFEVKQGYDELWVPCYMTQQEMRRISFYLAGVPEYELGTWGWTGPLKHNKLFLEGALGLLRRLPNEIGNASPDLVLADFRKTLTPWGVKVASRNLEDAYTQLSGSRLFLVDCHREPEAVSLAFLEGSSGEPIGSPYPG